MADQDTARDLAVRFLGVPMEALTPSRMDRIAGEEVAPEYRPGVSVGDPFTGAYRLTGWLYWIAAPGRIILEVDTWELGLARARVVPRT